MTGKTQNTHTIQGMGVLAFFVETKVTKHYLCTKELKMIKLINISTYHR